VVLTGTTEQKYRKTSDTIGIVLYQPRFESETSQVHIETMT